VYLAHLPTDHYVLRESHRDGDLLRSRDLFDLGPDPGQFIVYPGGNSFYVSEEVESWFESGRGEQEFIREFMDSHRQFHWPEPKVRVNDDRLTELFGMEAKVLHDMSRRELTRLFREKAHQHHPDKGGEHDSFVELAAAYAELLQGKK
jgi:hypothetical protein